MCHPLLGWVRIWGWLLNPYLNSRNGTQKHPVCYAFPFNESINIAHRTCKFGCFANTLLKSWCLLDNETSFLWVRARISYHGEREAKRPELVAWKLQELIMWMIMRPNRQQMLTCLYNPNPTNAFLPQKLWGMLWHPGDGDRPSVWATWHLLNLLFETKQNNFAAQCWSCLLSPGVTKGLPSPSYHCSRQHHFMASATQCNKHAQSITREHLIL